jgi:hypothetical protein
MHSFAETHMSAIPDGFRDPRPDSALLGCKRL